MKRQSTLRFFFSIGVVGVIILLTLGQLLGNLWFHKATDMDDGKFIELDAMQRALKAQPSHSFYWFSTGREFQDLSAGNGLTLTKRRNLLEEAEKYLAKAILLEPTASLYHYHLGWVYSALSPYRSSLRLKAQMAFSRAISLNPTNTEFRWGVGNYYLNQYRLLLKPNWEAQAGTEIDSARKNFHRHFRAFLKMRSPYPYELSRVLDRCFAVTQEYDDLRGLVPDQPSYHLRLAEFLSRKGMWRFARKEFETAISQDPGNPEAYHSYGSALFARDYYDEALAIWMKEQAISPQNPQSYLALSNAFWTLKREEEAIAELERLVDMHPDQTSYRLTLATRLEGAGDAKRALKAYRDALEKNPGDPKIYAQMASYWMRQKNPSEAEASLEQAISLSPSVTAYRDQLARFFFQQKRYSRAVQEWQDVLKRNPKFIGALKGIARSYEQLEAWSRALHYYKQALAIKPDNRSILQSIERIKKNDSVAGKAYQ